MQCFRQVSVPTRSAGESRHATALTWRAEKTSDYLSDTGLGALDLLDPGLGLLLARVLVEDLQGQT